jgi:sigma-B regulation protein RsbU (phosphoserine phosphatase)
MILGAMIFLFIILLELKDKLLAQEELEAGRSIQESLAPVTSPAVPHWDVWLFTRPANDVGGDLVDFMQINGNRYGIAIGDVAGKGLPAALLMAKLQSTLRALAPDYKLLNELAAKINSIFYRDSLPNRFASLLYIELLSTSNKLRFVNAGHFPPLHLKQSRITELEKGAPALGIMPQITLSEESLSLEKGDLFLVYSDGLTEARNEEGEFFGEDRLKELIIEARELSAEKAGQEILSAVETYVGEAPATDDLSMVVLRYTG